MSCTSASPKPELSVVVVILTGRIDCLARCLAALTRRRCASAPEIIVPCDESVGDLSILGEEFPEVEFLRVKGIRTYAELRAMGVRESQGRIVALTEDHCIASPDWGAQILRAHEAPYAAIGGAVDKKSPDSSLNWAMYLADYLRYMNPVPEGPTNHLTDCNVTYKRTTLDSIADVWADEFHEPVVHARLQARGESLWLDPRVVVYQQRSLDLSRALKDRYAFGRLFASTRAVDFSAMQRLLYCLLSVLLPAVLVGRVALHVISKRRCIGEFIRSLPYLILISTVWACGEFLGYVTGRAETSLTPKAQRAERLSRTSREATI